MSARAKSIDEAHKRYRAAIGTDLESAAYAALVDAVRGNTRRP